MYIYCVHITAEQQQKRKRNHTSANGTPHTQTHTHTLAHAHRPICQSRSRGTHIRADKLYNARTHTNSPPDVSVALHTTALRMHSWKNEKPLTATAGNETISIFIYCSRALARTHSPSASVWPIRALSLACMQELYTAWHGMVFSIHSCSMNNGTTRWGLTPVSTAVCVHCSQFSLLGNRTTKKRKNTFNTFGRLVTLFMTTSDYVDVRLSLPCECVCVRLCLLMNTNKYSCIERNEKIYKLREP